MVIELRVLQFWSDIILGISNQTRAARSFDFEITYMIYDQIALHSAQLPLFVAICEFEWLSTHTRKSHSGEKLMYNRESIKGQSLEVNALTLLQVQENTCEQIGVF